MFAQGSVSWPAVQAIDGYGNNIGIEGMFRQIMEVVQQSVSGFFVQFSTYLSRI